MRGYDNAHDSICPGTTKLEAYKLDGTFLWRIDLGANIREGAHYTPFIVYDLDIDGIAENPVRTAESTIEGTGTMIGDTNYDGKKTMSVQMGEY
jgi:rhamnogalacturonan endolyase